MDYVWSILYMVLSHLFLRLQTRITDIKMTLAPSSHLLHLACTCFRGSVKSSWTSCTLFLNLFCTSHSKTHRRAEKGWNLTRTIWVDTIFLFENFALIWKNFNSLLIKHVYQWLVETSCSNFPPPPSDHPLLLRDDH